MAPEIPRLQGELLMGPGKPDPAEAERCLREAIALARKQESNLSNCARRPRSRACSRTREAAREEARSALAELYGKFTEGFRKQRT